MISSKKHYFDTIAKPAEGNVDNACVESVTSHRVFMIVTLIASS